MVQDLFVMEDNEDGSAYRFMGKWRQYTRRIESIAVKGSASTILEVRESVFGPVISDLKSYQYLGHVLSLQWTTISPHANDTSFRAYVDLNVTVHPVLVD